MNIITQHPQFNVFYGTLDCSNLELVQSLLDDNNWLVLPQFNANKYKNVIDSKVYLGWEKFDENTNYARKTKYGSIISEKTAKKMYRRGGEAIFGIIVTREEYNLIVEKEANYRKNRREEEKKAEIEEEKKIQVFIKNANESNSDIIWAEIFGSIYGNLNLSNQHHYFKCCSRANLINKIEIEKNAKFKNQIEEQNQNQNNKNQIEFENFIKMLKTDDLNLDKIRKFLNAYSYQAYAFITNNEIINFLKKNVKMEFGQFKNAEIIKLINKIQKSKIIW